ncbi:hypothetical protein MMC27_007802 [Xylographa pallens]|nr:hypothetical protein [Xylographa pallens]
MFLRLREFARKFFGRQVTVSPKSSSIITVEEQILEEEVLVKASRDMVTTRAQDHGLGEAVVEEKLDGVKNGKKRRSDHAELSDEREATSTTKRRRLNQDEEVESGIEKSSQLQNSGDDLGSQGSDALLQLSEQSTVTSQSTLVDTTTPLGDHISKTPPPSLPNGGKLSVTIQPLEDSVEDKRTAIITQNGDSEAITRSNMGKKRSKADDVARTLSNGQRRVTASVIQSNTHSNDSRPEMKKATHKRFGSEEGLPLLALPSNNAVGDQNVKGNGTNQVQIHSEVESEDDSPEVVTASAGLREARTAVAEAARAAETQSLARKDKRRARDAHLKEQAATSKKERRSHVNHPSKLDDATSAPYDSTAPKPNPATAGSKKTFKRTDPLPDRLPADVLAAEPIAHPPTPPRIVTIVNPRKRRFCDADPKPPKDLKRGSVTVRILEENNSTLPPRSSKLSKSLKESWLAGQRGRHDVASRRLKMGGGFVRK